VYVLQYKPTLRPNNNNSSNETATATEEEEEEEEEKPPQSPGRNVGRKPPERAIDRADPEVAEGDVEQVRDKHRHALVGGRPDVEVLAMPRGHA